MTHTRVTGRVQQRVTTRAPGKGSANPEMTFGLSPSTTPTTTPHPQLTHNTPATAPTPKAPQALSTGTDRLDPHVTATGLRRKAQR